MCQKLAKTLQKNTHWPISFTYDAQFGWGSFPLNQGDGCAQLEWMDLKENKLAHMLLAP